MSEIVVEFLGGPHDRWHRWAVRPTTEAATEVARTLMPRVHAVRIHRGDLDTEKERAASEARQLACVPINTAAKRRVQIEACGRGLCTMNDGHEGPCRV